MADLPATAPVRVWALPPVWGAPNPSPFVIKLLTWLRMAGIAYETPPMTRPPASRTGKIPYVELADGRILYDSGLIVETLAAERGVDLDAGLDPLARARGHVIRRACEEHLYFAGAWERWLGAGAERTRADYFRHLPAPLRPIAAFVATRNMRRNLHGQGLARHRPEDVVRAARADVDALATLVGAGPYVLGDTPRTVDATVHGLLWALRSNPYESAMRALVEGHPNLVAYSDRMRERYWGDWR
ncbi:MAG: glutathione S-transferase family protein [Myxococcota bacterium]